jgi:hypothetical protein
MFVDELEGYFGTFGADEKGWINSNLESLGDDEKMNYVTALKNLHGKRDGVPSIQNLKIALEKVTGKKQTNYMWSVCLECGCEYDYRLPICPSCFEKGLECRAVSIRKSDFQPSLKVIKFNKTYLGDGTEQTCYNCVHKSMSYCKHFGNPDWACRELQDCHCAHCCIVTKKANEKMRNQKTIVSPYTKPLKR